jgi:hypothetical protein
MWAKNEAGSREKHDYRPVPGSPRLIDREHSEAHRPAIVQFVHRRASAPYYSMAGLSALLLYYSAKARGRRTDLT